MYPLRDRLFTLAAGPSLITSWSIDSFISPKASVIELFNEASEEASRSLMELFAVTMAESAPLALGTLPFTTFDSSSGMLSRNDALSGKKLASSDT